MLTLRKQTRKSKFTQHQREGCSKQIKANISCTDRRSWDTLKTIRTQPPWLPLWSHWAYPSWWTLDPLLPLQSTGATYDTLGLEETGLYKWHHTWLIFSHFSYLCTLQAFFSFFSCRTYMTLGLMKKRLMSLWSQYEDASFMQTSV